MGMKTSDIRAVIDDLDRFRGLIEEALGYSNHTHKFDDIVEFVMTRRVLFWPRERSFLLTEFVQYPQCTTLHIFLAGGDLAELIGMHEEVEHFAVQHGCTSMTIAGRKGWSRALKASGWVEQLVFLRKELVAEKPTPVDHILEDAANERWQGRFQHH